MSYGVPPEPHFTPAQSRAINKMLSERFPPAAPVAHPALPPFPPHTPGVHRALWISEGRCAVSLKDAPEGTPLLADNIPNSGDALLYAAAPDMYAACVQALQLLENARSIEYRNDASLSGCFPEVDQLKAALAKANGTQEGKGDQNA